MKNPKFSLKGCIVILWIFGTLITYTMINDAVGSFLNMSESIFVFMGTSLFWPLILLTWNLLPKG